ncbi:hypothetical protein PR048_023607 [Dryococelus australis]|uniref:Uncharacterized protein n=1 Tax=Dryococelus australis TaxID=614101 RepID=A0ABQ9GUN4_9NEOP|nr:hypothetical protein PR048_023607 [Dryococelus australis]
MLTVLQGCCLGYGLHCVLTFLGRSWGYSGNPLLNKFLPFILHRSYFRIFLIHSTTAGSEGPTRLLSPLVLTWKDIRTPSLAERHKVSYPEHSSDVSNTSDIQARGCTTARLIASCHGEAGSIPGGLTPGFSHVGIVLDDAACRRVFSRYFRFPRPCIPAPLHPRIAFHVMSGDDGHLRVPAGKPVTRRVLPRPGFTPHSIDRSFPPQWISSTEKLAGSSDDRTILIFANSARDVFEAVYGR